MTERHVREDEPISIGLGAEDLEVDHGKPDFERGAGGEPLITMPDGKRERYARTSSLGNTLDETSALSNWLVAKGIEGVARDDAILARAKAVIPYEDHKSEWTKLRQDAIQAGRGARKADIGTAVHAMSERWETDPTFDPGEPYRSALEAYTKARDALGLVSQMMEVQMVNDVLRVAGTTDRIYELTIPLVVPTGEILLPGTLIIGDLKTGDRLEYSAPGYAVQFAGYAGAVLYDVVNNVRMPTPSINQRWALLVHIHVENATCEFLWVDLEVGRFGANLANEVKEWRRNWRRKNGYMASLLPVKVASDGDVEIVEEDADEVPEHENLDAWIAYHKARLLAIRENVEAKEWMMVRWTPDLVAPKKITTLAEAHALDAFLDRVEAQFGMTFVEGRPTPPRERGSGSSKPVDAGARV